MNSGKADYGSWVGNQETVSDLVTAASVAAMSATLDRDELLPQSGDVLPALWHWMYFAPKARWSKLGADGHPERGGFLPPIALPNRMFAGAQYRFHRPILIGDEVRREGTILDVTEKQGRSGKLVFVKVGYVIATQSGVALEENHDIVYRDKAKAAQGAPEKQRPEPPEATWRRLITPDPVLLFRYSALTFNAHRIHYDRPYAMNEEGYPGLVVHGPLIATLLLELLREHAEGKALVTFNFRAVRPLFDTEPFEVAGASSEDGAGFWLKALGPRGRVAMVADGTFAR